MNVKHAKLNWISPNLRMCFLLGKQMSNRKLGILGMGRIGQAVAKRARAFGMEIHYHNRSKLIASLQYTMHFNITGPYSFKRLVISILQFR